VTPAAVRARLANDRLEPSFMKLALARPAASLLSVVAALACTLPLVGCSGGGGGATPGRPAGSVVDDGGQADHDAGGEADAPRDGAGESSSATDGGGDASSATDGGGEGSAGDGGAGPVCGSTTCASTEFCLASCASSLPLSPNFCTPVAEGGACPVEHPFVSSCLGGTGVDAGAPGCTVATYGYTCQALTPGQTSYNCALVFSQWSVVPIVNGVATCCED
jgi:hypothetical protein